MLMGVVLVLLIARANLATFCLPRQSLARVRYRPAWHSGLTRARIVGQILIENIFLSFSGGVAGAAAGFLGNRVLINFVVGGATYTIFNPRPDARVLAFTFGICLLTGLLFGDCARRACLSMRTTVAPALKANAHAAAGGAELRAVSSQKCLWSFKSCYL